MLPPREAGDPTLILTVARRRLGSAPGGDGGHVPSIAFLIDPIAILNNADDPLDKLRVLTVNDLPGPFDMGARDPFCGAHILTAAGDLFWVGGTDVAAEADDPSDLPYGHDQAYIVRRIPGVPWDPPGLPCWEWVEAGTMGAARWYPSVITLPDGRKLIVGHANQPVTTPPAEETREYVSIVGTTASWLTPAPLHNFRFAAGCGAFVPLGLGEYPQLRAVSSEVIHWTGRDHLVTTFPEVHEFTDAVLDFLTPCNPEPERWLDYTYAVGPHPQEAGKNSVHVINLARTPIEETVYTVGGATHDAEVTSITDQVVKMSDPSEAADWSDEPPDLHENVIDANTVILLDGSFLRVGGYGAEKVSMNPDVWIFPARKHSERFEPPEIFETPWPNWRVMAQQRLERLYHSVALLHPDGSVVSLGGQDSGTGSDHPSWHSLEIFRPPYLYPLVRPRITSAPTASIEYESAQPFDVSVILRTTSFAPEFRVALIGPGSATHGVDFSQRYVVLPLDLDAQGPPNPDPNGVTLLKVDTSSLTTWIAPPGWYMLTVVNSSGIPAYAKWVKVVL